ncbi:SDR family NAD(P)-dependent oxidoreductase [Prosthecomicrobium sp. N25]|uniref:SDR family NAD(P)-dependent oxidoreductase n=1 Tax=Prosthecomicrobium sp. N25 TaxID=3129254 RepID=UPI003078375C
MTTIRQNTAERDSEISIVGTACRLPSAPDVSSFWRLLEERRCAVGRIGRDRFATERYLHPDKSVPGKTYTFSAGLLDDVFGFDPGFFGISPREAMQMDPQQRILLQVTYEALENAGLKPSKLAGEKVGVFVGASSSDYMMRFFADLSAIDAQMMTGNTLSIISNRISYIFDLRGPSFTVDTACSSSLVALHEAAEAIRAGRIDTAIVAGVNVLASPTPFIGFARASMLSPTGLCRAFDANGDGYVRSEGAVSLVLKSAARARADGDEVLATIVGTGINSDGRTVGLSLPSSEMQAALLEEVYGRFGIDPDCLAFVEAHGTGTRVGDPAEAGALGRVLGQKRSAPLPIGSVKTNVGHLEPASGVTGVLKSILALRHEVLPASLHFETPNPEIPFAELNLAVARDPVAIPRGVRPRHAGINSFGFGGANAHVVIREGEPVRPSVTSVAPVPLVISARSREALKALATAYRDRLAAARPVDAQALVARAAHGRDRYEHRLVTLPAGRDQTVAALDEWLAGNRSPQLVDARAPVREGGLAFVFSGNGSQWAGMGRVAYRVNADFRRSFERVDRVFMGRAGWSLLTTMFSEEIDNEIERTEVAQPLLFGIQVALVEALAIRGIEPRAVVGHSVGEVAAAWAAGALDLADAVKVIHARSTHQEITRHLGGMAALLMPAAEARKAIAEAGFPGIEIAAVNSPRGVTISGAIESLEQFLKHARSKRWAFKRLDLDYPFHCALVDPIREPLMATLAGIEPRGSRIPFVSTVKGAVVPGGALDAQYWWDNVRQPVAFEPGLRSLAESGYRVFLEIGPRPVLGAYVNDILKDLNLTGAVLSSLDRADAEAVDPIARIASAAVANGAAVADEKLFGPHVRGGAGLPSYPWQNQPYRIASTDEAATTFAPTAHPLLGVQDRAGSPAFFNHLDVELQPWLADHKVDGAVVVPAAGLAEMALAAGREILGADHLELKDFDIVRALVLEAGEPREVQVRISQETMGVDILSRHRLAGDDWSLHARGALTRPPVESVPAPATALPAARRTLSAADLYTLTRGFGLDYGPAFRRAAAVEVADGRTAFVRFAGPQAPLDETGYLLHPTILDSAFHGLFALLAERGDAGGRLSFLPTRLGSLRVYAPGAAIARARIELTKGSSKSIEAAFTLLTPDGSVAATLTGARFSAVQLQRESAMDDFVYRTLPVRLPLVGVPSAAEAAWPEGPAAAALRLAIAADQGDVEPTEGRFLVDASATYVAAATIGTIVGPDRDAFRIEDLVASGRLHADMAPLFARMLAALAEDEQAVEADGGWRLADDSEHPTLESLVRTVVADHPAWIAEATLLSRLADALPRRLAEGGTDPLGSDAMREHLATGSPSFAPLAAAAVALVRDLAAAAPKDRPLSLLVLGAENHGFVRRLLAAVDAETATVTLTDPDPHVLERARLLIGDHPLLRTAEWASFDGSDGHRYDAAVSADSAHRWPDVGATLALLARGMAGGGALILSEPEPTLFLEMLRGASADWWRGTVEAGRPVGRLPDRRARWAQLVGQAGFRKAEVLSPADGSASAFLVAAVAPEPVPEPEVARAPGKVPLVLVANGEGRGRALSDALVAQLNGGRRPVRILIDARPGDMAHATAAYSTTVVPLDGGPESDAALRAALPDGEIEVCFAYGASAAEDDPEAALLARTAAFASLARALGEREVRVWTIAPGAVQSIVGVPTHRPVQAGLWGFARVVANEYPNLDIRLIDPAPTLAPSEAAIRIAHEIAHAGPEREIVVDTDRRSALRIRRGSLLRETALKGAAGPVTRRLEIAGQGSLDRLVWDTVPRRAPGEGEVEIEIRATGLNFRDVMWAMGLLPPEALEDGFAGPTLGMECSGVVTAVGPGVAGLSVGDTCVAFAAAAFAGHVTVPAHAVAPLSAAMSPEAAATIPVAFLTSYYALVHLARIEEGETVLVHGGAGGVGLAALQIAKTRGATVIATAGSREKRALLEMLGADHVLDSRSLAFADEVLRITGGEGVDVVLNSLAGEAMERSVQVLKPFGRFLELGKRDFYANTKLGLRPFRQNLSYFGIDADQLLTKQRKLAERLFRELMSLFDTGALTALPFRAFAADEATAAFRLMQQAGHVGKIVITPPATAEAAAAPEGFRVTGDGRYLIVGGLGGFGLALARRLAQRGARHLVLIGRRGRLDPDGLDLVREIEAMGASVEVAAVDAADPAAVEAFLGRLQASGPKLKGIFHTAMVLDDALVANLTPERIRTVLHPKVASAALLDRLTRGMDLDCFVLFSSATTLVGNPGQANYVAANAYLEALARKRRSEGLAGLAVAWGAIADAGYLARNTQVNDILARKLGKSALKVDEALDGLEALMALDPADMALAAIGYARIDWASAGKELALVKTPLFGALGSAATAEAAEAGDMAVREEIMALAPAEALERVVKLLGGEIGRILRMPADDIDRHKPLSEIGMDSLMALELRMAAESRLGVEIPLMSLANGATLNDIATRMVARIQGGDAMSATSDTETLANSHTDLQGSTAEDLAAVVEAIERRGQEIRKVL